MLGSCGGKIIQYTNGKGIYVWDFYANGALAPEMALKYYMEGTFDAIWTRKYRESPDIFVRRGKLV